MRAVYARYNAEYNSIDVTTFQGYVLRLDCGKIEERLRLTPGGQCELNALAIDEPLRYAVMALEGVFRVGWIVGSELLLLFIDGLSYSV